MCDSLYIDFLGYGHCVHFDTVRVILDSSFTIGVLEKSQEFYTNSFNNLLVIFSIVATVVVGYHIYVAFGLMRRTKRIAKKEARLVKEEIETEMGDFKLYVDIAFAVTKFRDSEPTKEDLKVLLKSDVSKASIRTIEAFVYALRKCLVVLEDSDADLAFKLDSFVSPIAKKLNDCGKYNVYCVLANQILMRTRIILGKK